MTDTFDVGDIRRLTATYTDFAAAVADPTAIVLTIREPDGVLVTKDWPAPADITKDSTGVFHYDFTIAKEGRHVVNWTSTGAVVAAGESEFWARQKNAA